MTYKEYLLTDEWKKKRKIILERANYRCQVCDSNKNLHVHHRTYENIYNENIDDLTLLCGKCHKQFHNMDKILELLKAFINNRLEIEALLSKKKM